MNGNTEEEIYLKFPTILKNRLKNKEIRFPKGTEYCYNAIKAFRAVERLKDDYRKVDRNDFQSYAESHKKKTRGRQIDQSKPEYYGVSLFRKKEIIENMMKFPNPKKKMAVGYVICQSGPQFTNISTEHVSWWLYADACVDGFVILEEGEDDESRCML